MVLAASEDKTFRGGFVAAPGKPWAWANDLQNLPVYHAVWSRDLYQIMTGLLAIGDNAAANRTLHLPLAAPAEAGRLLPAELPPRRQAGLRRPADGRGRLPDRHGVAARSAAARPTGQHVKSAADYIVAHGPSTPQERWENIGGYSPATIGAEVAGLVLAADIATAQR